MNQTTVAKFNFERHGMFRIIFRLSLKSIFFHNYVLDYKAKTSFLNRIPVLKKALFMICRCGQFVTCGFEFSLM